MTYRTSLPLHETELGCPPNCSKRRTRKKKDKNAWAKQTNVKNRNKHTKKSCSKDTWFRTKNCRKH